MQLQFWRVGVVTYVADRSSSLLDGQLAVVLRGAQRFDLPVEFCTIHA